MVQVTDINPIYYNYVLFRPWNGIPCYVGKGRHERWRDHFQYGRHPNRHMARIFDKAARLGLEVICAVINGGLTEQQAYDTEIALIAAIGRSDMGTGPLANRSGGGSGGDFGPLVSKAKKAWSEEERDKHRETYRKSTNRWWDALTPERRVEIIQNAVSASQDALIGYRADPEWCAIRNAAISAGHARRTKEQKAEAARKALITNPSDKRSAAVKTFHDSQTAEQRSKRVIGASTAEQRRERALRAHDKVPPEKRSAQVRAQQANLTDDQKQRRIDRALKLSAGRIWITNGAQCRRILPDEPIPEGWRRGKIHTPKPQEEQLMLPL